MSKISKNYCCIECGGFISRTSAFYGRGRCKSCGRTLQVTRLKNDLVGKKFGRLTVIELTSQRKYTSAVWKCKCECGNIIFAPRIHLIRNLLKSCGCYLRDVSRQRMLKYNNAHKGILHPCYIHGKSKDKLHRKHLSLIRQFGMSLEQYNQILKSQNYLCAICKQEESAKHRRTQKKLFFAVDHDHKTGKVRGLLCDRCNNLLARSQDNIIILENAIKYLKGNFVDYNIKVH